MRAAVEEFDMLPRPGMKVVAGVSGGADSVALLRALGELGRCAPDIFVCHFNHRLRGRESDRDADFVARLCEKKRLPFEIRSEDTARFSKRRGVSIEQGARELRYGFFRDVCERIGARRTATAHTMDDRAETVLMRILRGSGNHGVSAIKPRSGGLIRPFIGISRSEVIEYLEKTGEKWVEDGSNELTVFTRNRIRKQLVPLLETFNPRINFALNRLADAAELQSSYVSRRAEDAFGAVFFREGSEGVLAGSVSAYRGLHGAVRSELLRAAYAKVKGGLERLEFSHVGAMDALLRSPRASGAVNLPCGVVLEKGYDVFAVSRAATPDGEYSETVKEEGIRTVPCGALGPVRAHFEKTSDVSLWGRRDTGHFSLERACFPIEVRNFRPGDRTVPLGMKGTRKLKSIFIDRKIPSFLRKRLPIFTCKGDIIWAGGVAQSDFHKAEKGKRHLRIKLEGTLTGILENCSGG